MDDDVVELVWQVFCSDPYAGVSSMAAYANMSYHGKKPLNKANVREALSQIGGDTVWREMLKGLEQGEAHYKEGYVVERLLELLSERADESEPISILAEGRVVSELQGTEAQGDTLADTVTLSASFRAHVVPLFSKTSNIVSVHEQLLSTWEGPFGVVFLACVLYTSGLSYATIGGWMGVHASTVCRW